MLGEAPIGLCGSQARGAAIEKRACLVDREGVPLRRRFAVKPATDCVSQVHRYEISTESRA